jgi:tetratricopeptide (TPR) repeat protein
MSSPAPIAIAPVLSSATTASLHEGYNKAAIALNNAAVSLLSRGLYQDAVATFKEAIKFMRSVTVHAATEDRNCAQAIASEEEIRRALDCALKRGLCVAVTEGGLTIDSPIFHIISSQFNPTRVQHTLVVWAGNTSHVEYPMTIDPIDFEDCDGDDAHFQSGVILYNYGIAYKCLATVTANAGTTIEASHQDIFQAKAHRIFRLTIALLAKFDENVRDNIRTYLDGRCLVLKIFLTHNLIQSSSQFNGRSEYYEHLQTMERLQELVEALRAVLPSADDIVARAA